MKFRTIISPERALFSINYRTPLFFIGSCFSEEIGYYLKRGKLDTEINPFGVLYNPVSVANSINRMLTNKPFDEDDLYKFKETYLSFNHDTSFTSASSTETLEAINKNLLNASLRLKNARCVFITFGTARVFRFLSSGQVVSNCHKIPSGEFSRELLDIDSIVSLWSSTVKKLKSVNPDIKIIFTVSPVRHWKDGAHGNQVSKSILFLSIDKLLSEDTSLEYFPSYELLIDDLRDYRFYKSDMLHPSPEAVKYIWEYFTKMYFDEDTMNLYNEIEKIIIAKEHRILVNNPAETESFKKKMIERIISIKKNAPFINFEDELKYFENL